VGYVAQMTKSCRDYIYSYQAFTASMLVSEKGQKLSVLTWVSCFYHCQSELKSLYTLQSH